MNEFLTYIEECVEMSREEFSGLPICPFARPARVNNKIRFITTDDFSPLHLASIARSWDEDDVDTDVLIVILLGDIDWPSLESLCEEVQQSCSSMEVFAGHPDSPVCSRGVYTRKDPMINLQFNRKDLLTKSRELLRNTSYYEN